MNTLLTSSNTSCAVASNNALPFRLVADIASLRALTSEWSNLLAESLQPEPMLSPDWLLTWWETYGQDRELRVGLFYEGDRLIGLAPLCRRRFRYRPGIPFRRLEPLGSDVDEGDGVCSDYLNLIVREGEEAKVVNAFVTKLRRGAFGAWDEFVLPAMDGTGPMPGLLVDAFRAAGIKAASTQVSEAPFLALPASWEDYLRGINRKKRHGLVHAMREFDAWAGTDYSVERVTSNDDLATGYRILRDLHNGRWKETAGGVFGSPRFSAFHEKVMARYLERGQLDLSWLKVRGEPVSAHYSFVAGNKVYFYQCGRKMDVPHKVRLGILMVVFALQHSIAKGLTEFDFLAGALPYKREFTHTSRPIVEVRAARSCVAEWVRLAAVSTRNSFRSGLGLLQKSLTRKALSKVSAE